MNNNRGYGERRVSASVQMKNYNELMKNYVERSASATRRSTLGRKAMNNSTDEICKSAFTLQSTVSSGVVSRSNDNSYSINSISTPVSLGDSMTTDGCNNSDCDSTSVNIKTDNAGHTCCNIGFNTTAALVPETTQSRSGLLVEKRRDDYIGTYGDMYPPCRGGKTLLCRPRRSAVRSLSPKSLNNNRGRSVTSPTGHPTQQRLQQTRRVEASNRSRGSSLHHSDGGAQNVFSRSRSTSARIPSVGNQCHRSNVHRSGSPVSNPGFSLAELRTFDMISFGSSSGSVQLRISKGSENCKSADQAAGADVVTDENYGKDNINCGASTSGVSGRTHSNNSSVGFDSVRVSFDSERGRMIIERFSLDVWANNAKNNVDNNVLSYGLCGVSKYSLEAYATLLYGDVKSIEFRHDSKSAEYDRPPNVVVRTKKLLIIPPGEVNVGPTLSESINNPRFMPIYDATLTFSSCFQQKIETIFKLLYFKTKGILPPTFKFIRRPSPKGSNRLNIPSVTTITDPVTLRSTSAPGRFSSIIPTTDYCRTPTQVTSVATSLSNGFTNEDVFDYNIDSKAAREIDLSSMRPLGSSTVSPSPSAQMEYDSPSNEHILLRGPMYNNKRDLTSVNGRGTRNLRSSRNERLDQLVDQLNSLHV